MTSIFVRNPRSGVLIERDYEPEVIKAQMRAVYAFATRAGREALKQALQEGTLNGESIFPEYWDEGKTSLGRGGCVLGYLSNHVITPRTPYPATLGALKEYVDRARLLAAVAIGLSTPPTITNLEGFITHVRLGFTKDNDAALSFLWGVIEEWERENGIQPD